jgi:NADP-dependent 3-hydroxy acid dehydrogenase YdfG
MRFAEARFEIVWSTLPLPALATTTNALAVIANIAMQDPRHVARAVRFALTRPRECVVAEIPLPIQESSWP